MTREPIPSAVLQCVSSSSSRRSSCWPRRVRSTPVSTCAAFRLYLGAPHRQVGEQADRAGRYQLTGPAALAAAAAAAAAAAVAAETAAAVEAEMAACAAAFAAARLAASAAWAALAAPPTASAMAGDVGSAQATFPSAICLSRARGPRLASPLYKIASSPAACARPPNAAPGVSTGPAERAMASSLAAASLTLPGSAIRHRAPNNALSLRSPAARLQPPQVRRDDPAPGPGYPYCLAFGGLPACSRLSSARSSSASPVRSASRTTIRPSATSTFHFPRALHSAHCPRQRDRQYGSSRSSAALPTAAQDRRQVPPCCESNAMRDARPGHGGDCSLKSLAPWQK